jgi:epoxyqueuosine reductase
LDRPATEPVAGDGASAQTTAALKRRAKELGFDLCGVARAEPIEDGSLERWLARGDSAGLPYMHHRIDERLDPRRVVPGARSVVALAVNYWLPDRPETQARGVARYARGKDYHLFVRRRLRKLRRWLLDRFPGARVHPSVDTSPVMEKVWAQRAGLGWVGRNGLLITPEFGSWVLLGTLITTAPLAPDEPHPFRCGGCTACLPACPTGALRGEGEVDSRRCLAYWNIETHEAIPEELRAAAAEWTFGCDVCQEVCPWNRETPEATLREFEPGPLVRLRSSALATLGPEEFVALGVGSPMRRPGYDGLRRNAALTLLHAPPQEATTVSAELAHDRSPVVREAATWVQSQLRSRS